MEMLPGYVISAVDEVPAGEDWPLLRFDDGVGWTDGGRLLTGPAAKGDYFVRLALHDWILLDESRPEGNAFTVVAGPPVR